MATRNTIDGLFEVGKKTTSDRKTTAGLKAYIRDRYAEINSDREKNVPCDCCQGTGQMTVTSHEHADGKVKTSKMQMSCHKCDGNGSLTPAQVERERRYQAAWCRCTEPGEAIYYNHGGAHGYTCSKCDKILQTG